MYMYRLGYLSPIISHDLTLALMKMADDEAWDLIIHDCSNRTKFARDLHLGAKESGWFGASPYHSEFTTIPYEAFLPILQDETFSFLSEEPLPEGYNAGEMMI